MMLFLSVFLTFALSVDLLIAQDSGASVPKASDPFLVLTPEFGYSDDPKNMTRQYMQHKIDQKKIAWNKRYESVKTKEDAIQYQEERIAYFRSAIGPLPEKTPLNPQIVKTFHKDGYRVEAIILETRPQFYLTGLLFLPDDEQWKPPYPTMLVACGHTAIAKEVDTYQKPCILAARNGIAAFIVDPIDQGERSQFLNVDGKPYTNPTAAHDLGNLGSILLGRSTASFMIWDLFRSLDYLESRTDIDQTRLGVAGNSGGGTQSSYLMALDPRIAVAAPSCYLCGLYGDLVRTRTPQDAEQNIFGQLGFGMDHADYVMMRAPRPTLLCAATKDFFPIHDTWDSFRYTKRFYDRFGAGEYVSLIETDDKHGWSKNLREASVRWMVRWFYDTNRFIVEPEDFPVLTAEETYCTEQRQVLKIEGARSTYDLNREEGEALVSVREELWKDGMTDALATRIRERIVAKKINKLPKPTLESKGTFDLTTPGGIETRIERLVMVPEPGIAVPILRWTPKRESALTGNSVLFLHDKGKAAGLNNSSGKFRSIEDYLREGRSVVSADLRGYGETEFSGVQYFRPDRFGPDGTVFYMGYLLGLTHVGMRTEDTWNLARWLKQESGAALDLYALGTAGVVALHAAALEPDLFETVLIEGVPGSWSDLVRAGAATHPITNLVHNALTLYDTPDLVRSLGVKLTFKNPETIRPLDR